MIKAIQTFFKNINRRRESNKHEAVFLYITSHIVDNYNLTMEEFSKAHLFSENENTVKYLRIYRDNLIGDLGNLISRSEKDSSL